MRLTLGPLLPYLGKSLAPGQGRRLLTAQLARSYRLLFSHLSEEDKFLQEASDHADLERRLRAIEEGRWRR
jgi:hypothetical protein